MTYDILYELRGDKCCARHLATFDDEEVAKRFCRRVELLPKGTIHYTITCDDGRTIWDTRTQGLL